jgi:hypothetical protein
MKTHPPTAAVRESFGQAQQQAAAMVSGAPTPWNQAADAQRRSPLWIGVATLAVVAGGVAGWFGVDRWGRPAPSAPALIPAASDRVIAPALPAPVATVAAAPPIVTAPSLTVTRRAGVIRIAAGNAPLTDVVRALAQATRTNVKGSEALAAVTIPVTLTWQGSDTAAAWEALLGRFASTAIACDGAGCELWIVSVNAARAAQGVPATAATAAEESVPAPPPSPAAVAPPAPTTQGGEENTETN